MPDETKETASAFMRNTIATFTARGIKIQRVLTDNGSCYRSRAFAAALTEAGITHKRTRPYRPQPTAKHLRILIVVLRWVQPDPGQSLTMVSFVRFVGWAWRNTVECAGQTDLT